MVLDSGKQHLFVVVTSTQQDRDAVCTGDGAGESYLRLSKRFAMVTSTVPDDSIRECLARELYMKLAHTGAARRQGHLW